MKNILFICIIFMLVILSGCNVKHCIKYENEKYGDFEYCYDATASEIEGAPVLTNEDDVSLIGVESSFLGLIGDKLSSFLIPKTLNYEKKTYSDIPENKLNKIKRLLKELERRKIKNANTKD